MPLKVSQHLPYFDALESFSSEDVTYVQVTWTPKIMQLWVHANYHWQYLAVCHHPNKICMNTWVSDFLGGTSPDKLPPSNILVAIGHMQVTISHLICHLKLRDHKIQGSCNFMNGGSSQNVITLPSLVAIGNLVAGYIFFNWDSLHASLNSYYKTWSYKKKSTKILTHSQ